MKTKTARNLRNDMLSWESLIITSVALLFLSATVYERFGRGSIYLVLIIFAVIFILEDNSNIKKRESASVGFLITAFTLLFKIPTEGAILIIVIIHFLFRALIKIRDQEG